MTGDILGAIDAAVRANLCGCGCGQQIPDRGPSPDFVNEKHQQAWEDARRNPKPSKPTAQWLERLNYSVAAATTGDCDDTNCACHSGRWQAHLASITIESYTRKPKLMRRILNRIRRNTK